MDNTQEQNPEKKKLNWLWWVVIVIVLIIVAWVWLSKGKVDAQMKRVRSFREKEEPKPPTNV